MKSWIKYTGVVVLLSLFVVSCSKEEVKPFSNVSGTSALNTIKDGDDVNTMNSNASETTNGGDNTQITEGEDDGITDGGGSSDYDTTKKKKKN